MSTPVPHGESKRLHDLVFWPAVILFCVLAISAILQWLLAIELDREFWDLLAYHWLFAAVLSQVAVALVVVLAWKTILELHGVHGLRFRQALVMIGINSIGKYSPGKVVGIVARGAALYRLHADGRVAVQSAMVEQVAMLHSGAAVLLLAWLLESEKPLEAMLGAVLVLISVLVVARSGEHSVDLVLRLLRRLGVSRKDDPSIEWVRGFDRSYGAAFVAMTIVWMVSALTLYLCVLTFDQVITANYWWLLWVLALAYFGGFAAFFLPAGIGAREGVLIAMLGMQMDLGIAAYVAVLHRLITLLIDLLLGGCALLLGRNQLAVR